DGMTDPVCAAPLNCLPDGLLSKRFPAMDRDVEVLALNVMKSVDMFLRRIAAFLTREVKTHNAVRPEVDSQFCDFLRDTGIHVHHRAQNQAKLHSEVVSSSLQPP